ncbi:alpha-amylase family glycosyl hydrolase [Adhaeribacter pallidiroseus]|uniref:4-alpha-D-((1->4)-alpha-D-glucano)trehalose trehalohydrolase n=1 Tax=Adhaeribacter pallidiroseus TaxID=2072847 RepID=A0A369QHG5_9BACT|nr:alpha-amylase family glycosyl hydrolase [Adhaeribacter pallidiroseus]RDC63872.1 4-alpha-D-((1->4)-alpha-D-glucano)trehalose trehalohydrolase [Adhaeribacter pallidiroseus]
MMQRFTFMLLVCLSQAFMLLGQAVTTNPLFPTTDQPVNITFDVSQAKDTRAAGLIGKTDDVYLWSGAGTTSTNAFELQPTGQTDFAQPFAPGKMTFLGSNRWQITISPRAYYNISAGKNAVQLGLLLKNGAGSAQTEDFVIPVYANKLNAAFRLPEQREIFLNANTNLIIKGYSSAKATLTLQQNNQVLQSSTNQDSLVYALDSGNQPGVRQEVIFKATTATETAADTFYYTVKPRPKIAELPSNIKDGINYLGPDRVILSFFAPAKDFVYVIGEFNNWTASPSYLLNRTPDGNRYWLELNGLESGKETAYQYLVNGTQAVADPYTDKILDPNNDKFLTSANYPDLKIYPAGATGIVSVLQTNQPVYNWKVANFQRPNSKNLVVYELLVRDFVATHNYKTLADTLIYLKRLGVNAIELMPIMEFSGNDSWGYNPIFYFAPDKAYGTKNDLKAFIDKCHENGIAVILDMVLNQADYEFPYVKMYWDGSKPSADNPFFNQQATHPFSVFFDFNHEAEATKTLVECINRYWLEEYKFDGYRFDLSKGFTQKNSGDNVSAWGNYDASRVAIWKRIYDQIRSYDSTAYVLLEHFAVNPEEKELADYGMLFWGNSNHDYRDAAKGNIANPDWISYKKRSWQQPNVVGYLESHDEERLVYDVRQDGKAQGSYNTRELSTALERAKLAAAFFLPVPGPKLIWQFGELGYDVSINENGRTGAKPIRWEYQQEANRQKLYRVYAELNKLKLTQPAFQTEDFTLNVSGLVKYITLKHTTMNVHIIGNFDVHPQITAFNFPIQGKWYDYFTGAELEVSSPTARISLQPGEFHLYTTVKLPTPEPDLVPWSGTPGVVTAVVDELLNESLQVYPNPTEATTVINLKNNYRGPVIISLHDLSGRLLQEQVFFKKSQLLSQIIPLQQVRAGVFFLKITQDKSQAVKKLVKW